MANLDDLLRTYRADPDNRTHLDALMDAATRYSVVVARKLGHQDPEDIAQMAILRLYERRATIHTSVSHWIGQTVRRLVIDDYRKRQRQMDNQPMPDDMVIEDADVPPCRNIMTLPPELQKVAAALLIGYSTAEAVDIAGMSRRELTRLLIPR